MSRRRRAAEIDADQLRDMSPKTLDVAFVGHGGECAYFFEIRSREACATSKGAVGGVESWGGFYGYVSPLLILLVYLSTYFSFFNPFFFFTVMFFYQLVARKFDCRC